MRKLNFGCGADVRKSSKDEKWDNVDVQENPRLTNSFDFNKMPYPLKENTYDYVYAKSVLEHLDKPEEVLMELRRICKNGAIIEVSVPHYSNRGAYDDMQHIHFFNENAFKNFIYDRRKINNPELFRIRRLYVTPTKIGRLMPRRIRDVLSLFINGLHSKIWVKLEVVKS